MVAVSERIGGWVQELVVCELLIDVWSTVLASTETVECSVNFNELAGHIVVLVYTATLL